MAGRTTRIRSGEVQVEGLVELQRALREMGPEFKKELPKVNKQVATFVAKDAQAAAYGLGSVAAKVAPSVRASAGAGFAGVGFGGPAYPFAGGAEFGALQYKQFQPWRGNGSDAGYFVYPTIRRDGGRIETEYSEAAEALIQRVGLAL